MPYEDGQGTFVPEGSDDSLNYRIESWVEVDQYPERQQSIGDSDLGNVDFMVVEVWKDNPQEVEYETIYGPFDSWENIDDYLAYDFGEEGSRSGAFI